MILIIIVCGYCRIGGGFVRFKALFALFFGFFYIALFSANNQSKGQKQIRSIFNRANFFRGLGFGVGGYLAYRYQDQQPDQEQGALNKNVLVAGGTLLGGLGLFGLRSLGKKADRALENIKKEQLVKAEQDLKEKRDQKGNHQVSLHEKTKEGEKRVIDASEAAERKLLQELKQELKQELEQELGQKIKQKKEQAQASLERDAKERAMEVYKKGIVRNTVEQLEKNYIEKLQEDLRFLESREKNNWVQQKKQKIKQKIEAEVERHMKEFNDSLSDDIKFVALLGEQQEQAYDKLEDLKNRQSVSILTRVYSDVVCPMGQGALVGGVLGSVAAGRYKK